MTQLAKVTAATAAELCAELELGEEAAALLDPAMSPGQFLAALAAADQYADAVQFLAHALPRHESVWWACVCARSVMSADSTAEEVAALQAAEQWAYQPTEQTRRAAEAAAEADGPEHPAGFAAYAAFLSSGSMSLPDLPEVPPGPFLTAKAVNAALLVASVAEPAADQPLRLKRFLAAGIDIANGGDGTGGVAA